MVAADVSAGVPAVYVDNFLYTSDDKEKSCDAFDKVKAECVRRGLPTHEEERGVRRFNALGWAFDGKERMLRPTPRRVWRLVIALRYILQHPYLSSKQLEVIIGHFTFLALIRRPMFSIMRSVYAFVKKDFARPRRLWPSIERELRWMASLAPLLVCDLSLPPLSRVCCSDASLDGAGVTVGLVDPELVRKHCSYSDLWRFSSELQRSWGPRRQAFEESQLSLEVEQFCKDNSKDEMTRN